MYSARASHLCAIYSSSVVQSQCTVCSAVKVQLQLQCSVVIVQCMSMHYMHCVALLYSARASHQCALALSWGNLHFYLLNEQTQFHQLVKSSDNYANHVFHLELYCIIALSTYIALYHFGEIFAYAC